MWPSLIVDVRSATSASTGNDSCQSTCESYVQAYSKPCCSANWISSIIRLYGGSGRTVTPKLNATPGSLLRQDHGVKIICVGRNYAEHAAELGDDPPTEPLLFGKFENTLIGPGDAIVLPPEATHVDAEAELAVEIGLGGHRIPVDDALDHVRGYRAANDVSARNIQYAESQWTRAKGFDTFCPLGDRLVPVSELGDGGRPARRAAAERRGAAGRTRRATSSSPSRSSSPFVLERLHARAGRPDPHRTRRPASAGRATRRCRCSRATSSRSRSRGSACLRNPVVAADSRRDRP